MHVPIVPSDPSRDHTTIDHVIMSELKCDVVYRREAQHSKAVRSNIASLAAFLMGNGRFAQQAYKNRFWQISLERERGCWLFSLAERFAIHLRDL